MFCCAIRRRQAGHIGTAQQLGGLTSMRMVKNFIVSPEAQNIIALLHLYDILFNRAADSDGLTHWFATLKGGTSMHDIARAFSASSEFRVSLWKLERNRSGMTNYSFHLNRK